MNYTISLGRGNGEQVLIELYAGCPVDVPAYVGIGITNRLSRYKDWLNACVNNDSNDETKSKRLKFLAFIHKVGIEKGSICIQSKHPLREMQIKGVRDFLIEHKEFLDNALPYIFEDVQNISDTPPVQSLGVK